MVRSWRGEKQLLHCQIFNPTILIKSTLLSSADAGLELVSVSLLNQLISVDLGFEHGKQHLIGLSTHSPFLGQLNQFAVPDQILAWNPGNFGE